MIWNKTQYKNHAVTEPDLTEIEKKALEMKKMGLEVTINDYKQLPDLLPVTVCYYFIFLISVFIFPFNPILTFIINVLVTVGFYLEINGKLMLCYFLTLGKKQSILAKLPSRLGKRKLLFIVPKYYVGLSKPYMKNRSYDFIKKLFLAFCFFTFIFFIAFVNSVKIQAPAIIYWYISFIFIVPTTLYAFYVYWKSFFGLQPVAKKASYCEEVILDTINKVSLEGELKNYDIFVLFTQDRSGDYSAVLDLLDNHEHEIAGAKIVNLDFFDGGNISINYYEGIIKKFKTCKVLSLAIIGLENKFHFPKVKIKRDITMFSPLTIFLRKDYEGINLITESKALGESYDYILFFEELIRSLDSHL